MGFNARFCYDFKRILRLNDYAGDTMKKILSMFLLAAGLLLLSAPALHAEESKTPSTVPYAYVIEIRGVISPATYDLIKRHIANAERQKADIIVLQMHTPGGLYDSTRDIIQVILDSPVPVATYVSPGGSHAASAGTYILYASHIAAMAPGTNIGAATPVQMGQNGKEQKDEAADPTMPSEKSDKKKLTPGGSTLEHKMINDAAAYMRSLAEMRGRNQEWAEKAVREAESLTATEALTQKVIDVIANNIPDLLDKIDGKQVKMADGSMHTLKTRGASLETVAPDWRHKLLEIITHPNVAFLLMTLGFYGLVYEFANPGTLFPGIFGAIFLLLGLFAMNILPINYAGLALIFIGLALMAGEALTPSFGMLGIGGAVAFVAGAVMLFETEMPGDGFVYGIDPAVIGVVTLTSLGVLSVLLHLVIKSQKAGVTTGVEELQNAVGEVISWSQGKGDVRITGEIWQAVADTDFILQKGDAVRVVAVNGLKLTVAPAETK